MNSIPIYEQNIESIILKNDGFYIFKNDNVFVEALIQNTKNKNANIFIVLSSTQKTDSPHLSIHEIRKCRDLFPGLIINITTPSLYDYENKSIINCDDDKKENSRTKTICDTILKISQHLNINTNKIFIYGSSVAGFLAIRISSIIDGSTAIVINPQINIRSYIQSQNNNLLHNFFEKNSKDLLKEEIDVTIGIKATKHTKIVYAQNILEQKNFQEQYIHFCNETSTPYLGGFDPSLRFKTILYSSTNDNFLDNDQIMLDLINTAIDLSSSHISTDSHSLKPSLRRHDYNAHSSYTGDKNYNAFSKSFYICDKKTQLTSVSKHDYISIELGNEHAFYGSKNLRFNSTSHFEKKVIIVGICIDVNSPSSNENEIAKNLLKCWEKSKQTFEEYLFSLGGSYIIIVYDAEIYIYPDACGTFSVAYSKFSEKFAVGSHPRLVAEIINKTLSKFQKYWTAHKSFSSGGYYYPGNLTEFEDCLQLTPNTFISSKQFRIPSRFYPIRKIEQQDINTALERISEIIDAQVINITSRFKVNISLSGGLDSRVTLAAFNGYIDKVKFFTYRIRSNPILKQDFEIASELAKKLNLNHHAFDIKYGDTIPEYIYNELNGISPGNYAGADLTWAYTNYFDRDSIHIRSNLMEIICGYHLKNPANKINAYTPKKISSLFRGGTRDEFIGIFDQYLRDIQFHKISGKGYHYSDMFYWEHRMGVFVSNVLRRERPIMDTVMLFNNHELLTLGLSLSIEERKNADIVWKFMEKKYPAVLDVPFSSNGVPFSSIRHKTYQ